ncbi:TetR/AcrR family transcriptional regulator [Granulicella sp. WH15]|uniref:TetR/AcrR family transcriptional regulator n=1 Tax=Granulicella sp. WH15 TaxID=2602070 RepID=UPI0013674C8F|nr:TetR/AcrR family transcriptional regulator [Granulicella sp. WH15]QHN03337.1 TetR/AcrR family transcriptional regulator [Granulicella sp. WH15]
MARVKSADKRNAILTAATQVVAERGVGATTAAIAGRAQVSEGTIFTYFASKDELLNQLYRELKLELADAMMSGFPRRNGVRSRLQHVWNCYVDWGVENPFKHKALQQLILWSGLTDESKAAGMAPFVEIQQMHREATESRIFRELPEEFAAATMSALSETTVAFMQQQSEQAAIYRDLGFEMLWAAIARKK